MGQASYKFKLNLFPISPERKIEVNTKLNGVFHSFWELLLSIFFKESIIKTTHKKSNHSPLFKQWNSSNCYLCQKINHYLNSLSEYKPVKLVAGGGPIPDLMPVQIIKRKFLYKFSYFSYKSNIILLLIFLSYISMNYQKSSQ